MSLLFVQLLSGLANAMFLFLIASGLSLIFGVTRIVNFAHGSFYMLAAYLTYSLAAVLPGGPVAFYAAVLLAAVLVAALGGLVEVLLLRRVYRAPELYQLLLTFALVLMLEDVIRFVWGAAPYQLGDVYLAYGQLLGIVKKWVANGVWPSLPGTWVVHALCLATALVLLLAPRLRRLGVPRGSVGASWSPSAGSPGAR